MFQQALRIAGADQKDEDQEIVLRKSMTGAGLKEARSLCIFRLITSSRDQLSHQGNSRSECAKQVDDLRGPRICEV
jgi:hypothetical protein